MCAKCFWPPWNENWRLLAALNLRSESRRALARREAAVRSVDRARRHWQGHHDRRELVRACRETKLVHQDARLYLISHTSLHKRGFAPGMASAYQMLVAQEHRLVIPFSLVNLQCTLAGTRLPLPTGSEEPSLKRHLEPSLQALSTHLSALTDSRTSLPMALAQAMEDVTAWDGLGLLSRSSINDIVTALTMFCSHYSSENWGALLRQELPEQQMRTLNGCVISRRRWSRKNQLLPSRTTAKHVRWQRGL